MTRVALPAALLLALTASPAAAAGPAVLAEGGTYWRGFVDFWLGNLQKQNGVVMFAIGIGLLSLFIITRGKWKK